MRHSLEVVNKIRSLSDKYTYTEIAKLLGIERHSVARWINKRKYNPGDLIRKDRLVNINPFKDIESEETQYFLGLLATDGSLYKNKVELALKLSDIDILRKLKLFLKADLNLTEKRKTINSKIFYSRRISFRNIDIYNTIKSYGITENKTFTLKLNFPITWHVMRGIIDGDGCYLFSKCGHRIGILTASKEFSNQILEFLFSNEIQPKLYNVHRKDKIYYNISIAKCNDVIKCIQLLYNNAHVYIQRKHDTAKQLSNYLQNKRQSR